VGTHDRISGFIRRGRQTQVGTLLCLVTWGPLPSYDAGKRPSPDVGTSIMNFSASKLGEVIFSS
jgi:hypothetical protein